MENTSKRDIYDLIAELAKSSNIDLSGTEFTQEKVDVRKKSIVEESPEPNQQLPKRELIHLEPSSQPEPDTSSDGFLEQLSKAKASSIEELNILKTNAIEELNLVKAALLKQINPATNGHWENSIYINKPNKESKSEQFVLTAFQEQSLLEFNKIKTSTLEDIKAAKLALMNELENLKKIEPRPNITSKIIDEEIDFFETLTIEDLNNITSPEKKESKNHANNANDESINLANEFLQIKAKIDELSSRNLKTEIVNELKLSDARIIQEVNLTRASLLNDIDVKISNSKSNSNNNYIKWLAIINLAFLGILAMYLLFQKKMPTLGNKMHESTNTPATAASQNVISTNEDTLNNETKLIHTNESQVSIAEEPSITNSSFAKKNEYPILSKTSNSSASAQASNDVINSKGNTNKFVKGEINQDNKVITEEIKRNEILVKSKVEVAKKTPSKDDVYFGED